MAWKSAVTTQGRRSAAQTIQNLVVNQMKDIGFDVATRQMADGKDDVGSSCLDILYFGHRTREHRTT